MASCTYHPFAVILVRQLMAGRLLVFRNFHHQTSVDVRGTMQQTNTFLENSRAFVDKIDSSLLAIAMARTNRNFIDETTDSSRGSVANINTNSVIDKEKESKESPWQVASTFA